MSQFIIKKEYDRLPKAEVVRFTNDFIEAFLMVDDTMVDVPIDAFRIIFKIASDLRNSNFSQKNVLQYNLFHETYLTEHNTFALLSLNFNDIAINKNTSRVKKGLEFLVKHKQNWYKSKNKDGEIVESYGGIITNPSYKRGGATFLISSYWLHLLTYMPKYNSTFYNLVFNISNNKHLVFYLWLTTLNDFGTLANLSTLNNKFGLKYSDASEFCNSFLKSVKKNLDRYSLLSFNYSYKANKISVVPYYIEPKEVIGVKIKKTVKVSQKTHYWRVRHKLTLEQKKNISLVLKNDKSSIGLFLTAYSSFIKDCKSKDKKATDYKGKDFMKIFQEHIIESYKSTKSFEFAKNGYPRIL